MVMNPNDLGRPWQATMQLAACGCLGGFQTEAGLGSGGSGRVEGVLSAGGWGLYTGWGSSPSETQRGAFN